MKSVLWISAAPGPLAWASPLKKRMNGTLPPMTAIARSPSRRPAAQGADLSGAAAGDRGRPGGEPDEQVAGAGQGDRIG